jgi:hypothetical protein
MEEFRGFGILDGCVPLESHPRSSALKAHSGIGTKMGIKFLCPNGHKLHVKAFLSGKRAICPKCGARVVVPAENRAMAVGEPAPTASQSGVAEQSAEIVLEESLVDDALESMAQSDGTAAEEAATKPTAPTSRAIDEAPGAVWYVRPASGGQFGPASAEIMRGWLDEGRVGANSLVWRAGWGEWRSAAAAFPQLGPQLPAPASQLGGTAPDALANGMPPLPVGQVVQSVASSPPEVNPPGMPPLAQAVRKRRRKKDVRLTASAILVAVSLILVIVLVLVSRAQSDKSEPKLEEPPAADEETLI